MKQIIQIVHVYNRINQVWTPPTKGQRRELLEHGEWNILV